MHSVCVHGLVQNGTFLLHFPVLYSNHTVPCTCIIQGKNASVILCIAMYACVCMLYGPICRRMLYSMVSLVPRSPPRFYLAAMENDCEIKSRQRPWNEATVRYPQFSSLFHVVITIILFTSFLS